MARRVFLSFDYERDNWRVQQIKAIGAIEGQPLLAANRWEEVKAAGDGAIRKWIDRNMENRSCVIVLIGSRTSQRPWVRYEIQRALETGRGLLGVRVHKLNDRDGMGAPEGADPFATEALTSASILVNPAGRTGPEAYASIRNNINDWIERAIEKRASAR